MKTNDLLQTIVLNFHTALFLKEFDACTRDTPQCTLEDFRSAFISKHEILQQSEPLFPFSPYNQGTAISLAYSFIVLPFESGDDIEKWNPDIQSLKKFTVTKQPKDFIPSNGKMLKYLRHSIAHANIEIKPKVGRNHGEASVCFKNYPPSRSKDQNVPPNHEFNCSYSVFQEFLQEFMEKFLLWKIPVIKFFP